MDVLEKMFNNDNWMKVSGNDTSYYYFSRILTEMHVHQYRIVKGDSVITNISSMKITNDSIVWKYSDSTDLYLSAITEKSSIWANSKGNPSDSFYMSFELKDNKHINLVFPDKKISTLTRTLSLSSFLTRSRYDYLHGTKYAFSDTVFSTGKAKIDFTK